jgi:hypothetical protein
MARQVRAPGASQPRARPRSGAPSIRREVGRGASTATVGQGSLEAQNVGRLEAHEVLTSLNQNGGGRLQLMFTALLARGQISGVAVLGLTQSGASNARAAIIGGTGHYRNVRGEVLIHPNGQTMRLIFLLVP